MVNCFAENRSATCLSAKLPWGLFEYLYSTSCADRFQLLVFQTGAPTVENTEDFRSEMFFLSERNGL